MMFCACGTSRKAAEDATSQITNTVTQQQTTTTQTTVQSPAKQKVDMAPGVDHFVADIDLTVGFGGDTHNLGGKLSMKRDAVVRINLTFMGFMEVAILEFTPEDILIVNRMGKEYTRLKYNAMDALVKNNITFDTIQQMAWQNFYAGQGKKISDASLDKALENLLSSGIKTGKKITVHLEVGKPDTKKNFETKTTLKSSYTEIPAQLILSKLSSLN